MLTIICVGKIVAGGDVQWTISPLPVEEVAPDGTLQEMIDSGEVFVLARSCDHVDDESSAGQAQKEAQRLLDEAADTEDYEWDIDDRNIWRRGGW